MKSLEPGSPAPVITAITGQPLAKSNYQETLAGQANNDFLHIFEAAASAQTAMTPNAYVDAGLCEGAEVKKADSAWVVLFAKADSAITTPITYSFHYAGPQRHVVSDLTPYAGYNVKVSSKGLTVLNDSSHVASASGVATFAFTATDSGTVTLVPGKVPVAGVTKRNPPVRPLAIRVSGRTMVLALTLEAACEVKADIIDCHGRLVMHIVNSWLSNGRHTINKAIPRELAAGGYIVVCRLGGYVNSFKVVIGI
jgi:hypothetical protein